MIKGIDVILYNKTQTGTDALGVPIYTETPVTVHDVLVAPVSNNDITSEINLYGKQTIYELAIPKGDANEWENKAVQIYGERYQTVGIASGGIPENIPLRWNKKIRVVRYE